MHKKYHEKFKILDILAVTTQAHEGIETRSVQYTFAITRVPVPVSGKKKALKK